ncbi:MAG: hypothetical protein PHV74_08470 [Dehalococcoidia bacterium]|nr:hypothetical protein [Dehalococcoidia bacterium]
MKMKMEYLRGLKFCLPIILAMVIMLVAVAPAVSAESAPIISQEEMISRHVSVPIMFNGVLYQPDKFNKIQDDIWADGGSIGMIVTCEEPHPIAYESIESFDKYAKAHGMLTMADMLEAARSYTNVEDPNGLLRSNFLYMQDRYYYDDFYGLQYQSYPDLSDWYFANKAYWAQTYGSAWALCYRYTDYYGYPLCIAQNTFYNLSTIGWANDIESCQVS